MDGETKIEPLTAVDCTVSEILWACESMVGLPYDGEGGPMSEEEVAAFPAQPDWRLALKLRELDDRGKVPGAEVPGLEDYGEELTAVVSAQLASS